MCVLYREIISLLPLLMAIENLRKCLKRMRNVSVFVTYLAGGGGGGGTNIPIEIESAREHRLGLS